MKKIYIIVSLLLFSAAGLGAQVCYEGSVDYKAKVRKSDEVVRTDLTIDMSGMKLKRQEMVTFTPMVRSRNGDRVESFPPVIVAGPKRYRALMREMEYGTVKFAKEPHVIMKRGHGRNEQQEVAVHWNMPYGVWLRDADLVVSERVSGCARCDDTIDRVLVTAMLPAFFVPQYRPSFINPPVEEVKQRSETYVSHINYEVNKYELLRNYKDNAKVLDEVDAVMHELMNNPDLTVTKFTVTGYASPEGNFEKNQTLSENRAKSFLNYLKEKYGYNVGAIAYEGRGEDWDGLYKIVETLDIEDRDFVLTIIKDTRDVAERKSKLQALSGGRTYKYLLANHYPALRRNEYEISFIARAFNVEEAKALLRTRPHLLSQNELYLVAESYGKGTEGFKDVFRVAGDVFPRDPYANINYAAIAVEEDSDAEGLISRLQRIEMPEAYNNLAIAYFKIGATDLAEKYFRMAAEAGNREAIDNLRQFENWKNNF